MVISACWMAAGQGGTREQSHWRGHKSDKVIMNPGLQWECKTTWRSAVAGPDSSASYWYGMCPQWGLGQSQQLPGYVHGKRCRCLGLCLFHSSPSALRASRGYIRNRCSLGSAHSLGHQGPKHFFFTELLPKGSTIDNDHRGRSKTGGWSALPGRSELPWQHYLVVNLET